MSRSPQDSSPPRPLMACGAPISEAVADQAAQWLTVFMSGEITEDQRRQWQAWRQSHPDHERAWQHIEAARQRLRSMEPRAARKALASPDRRKVLSLMLWGAASGSAAWIAPRTQPWQHLTASHRTTTGEQQDVELEDGTRVKLNTRSAVDVRFDSTQRLLRLVSGEIFIATAHSDHGPDLRPFIVETSEGQVQALGTQFAMRQGEHRTHVSVMHSAVKITPRSEPDLARIVRAGEQTTFTRHDVAGSLPLHQHHAAWMRGQVIVDDTRLSEFLTDLARYRPGILRCDPAVADLRLSGVFPLQDTDRILATLPSLLPVQVRTLTRYWTSVEARS